jgi:hypothetical protein
MPYYVAESVDEAISIDGFSLCGVPTSGHSRALWLYVVRTDADPMGWPESPTGRATGRRRAPAGVENWWVVVEGGAKARSGDYRSSATPLSGVPEGFSAFDWP